MARRRRAGSRGRRPRWTRRGSPRASRPPPRRAARPGRDACGAGRASTTARAAHVVLAVHAEHESPALAPDRAHARPRPRRRSAGRRATRASTSSARPPRREKNGGAGGAAVGAARRGQRADQAAVPPFHLDQAREGRADREPLRVAGVDAGQERRAQARYALPAQPAPEKRRDRLVPVRASARDHEVRGHPQLARPGEQPRPRQRRQARGHAEHHARPAGGGACRPAARRPSVARGSCGTIRSSRPSSRQRLQRLRLLREQRVRAALHQEAVRLLRADDAAPARVGFQEHERHAEAMEVPGRGEPRDASADDRDLHAGHAHARRG